MGLEDEQDYAVTEARRSNGTCKAHAHISLVVGGSAPLSQIIFRAGDIPSPQPRVDL